MRCGGRRRAHTQRAASGAAMAIAAVMAVGGLVGCSDDDGGTVTVRLVTYSSFPKDGPLVDALAEFTADTGIAVELVDAGDTGTMVSKAVLTSGNPEGDVIWGVDNTFLSAAVDGKIFDGEPVQVDSGDVCVNADVAWFDAAGLAPPATLNDLTDPRYADLLVVQDPSTSSVGLAFLLATIAEYGEDGWQQYWRDLRANGVDVVGTWDDAYYSRFSGYAGGTAGGDRPLVVSYASSPPAEVVFADPPLRPDAPAPTISLPDTCFAQQEYAGVLRGSEHSTEARQLVEFLLSERFQRELPLTMFVYPANPDVELPAVFVDYGPRPESSRTVAPEVIAANRATWQDEWTQIVLR